MVKIAEDTLKKMLFGFVLTSLFAVLILIPVVNVGESYDQDTTEITQSLRLGDLNDTINLVRTSSENMEESFQKQSIWSTIAGVIVTGIFTIGKTMGAMAIAPFSILIGIMINVLKIPVIIADVIMGLLILSIIFAIWRLIKIGN